MNVFCNNLKFLREKRHLSQKDMAVFLNISVNSYQRYEYGTREPNLLAISQISDFFQVPTDFLLGSGVFSNWEEIFHNKSVIIAAISGVAPKIGALLIDSDDITLFIKVLSQLVEKVVFDLKNQQVHVFYHFSCLSSLEPSD